MKKLFPRLRERMICMGLRKKMTILITTVILLLMLLNIVGFYYFSERRSREEDQTYARSTVENTLGYLDTYFHEISAIENDCNYNYYLQNYLSAQIQAETPYNQMDRAESMQNYEMVSTLFNNTLDNRTDITSIMIFGRKQMLMDKSLYSYVYTVQDFTSMSWYKKALEDPSKSVATGPDVHSFLIGSTEKVLSMSRMIRNYEDGSFLGVILIDFNWNRISEIMDSITMNGEEAIALLNDNGELVYAPASAAGKENIFGSDMVRTVSEQLNKEKLADPDKRSAHFTAEVSNKKYQIVTGTMQDSGWTVVSAEPETQILATARAYIFPAVFAIITILLAILLALNILLDHLLRPILHLQKEMEQVNLDNLDLQVPVERGDEVGRLAETFNHMTGRILNLKEQVVREQTDKRHYELKALQAQINPHFLYNTLDSIIWMAEMKDPDVVPMTEALARLMRLTLSKGKEFIPVRDELEHVRNYLIIQSMRYTDKFDYSVTADETVENKMTIKLIVQPIVENSIYHGIKTKKGKCRLDVYAYQEAENLCIKVTDNGSGMSEEQVKNILNASPSGTSGGSGIGVRNVNERIQLSFGTAYGVFYTSTLGEGTEAVIRLPILTADDVEKMK